MITLDAMTGAVLKPGSFTTGGGLILRIEPGWFVATAIVQYPDERGEQRVPMPVGYLRPGYEFRRVAVFPS